MKRLVVILCWLLLLGVLFWLFPLFHIVPLEELDRAQQETQFDAAEFSKSFWIERLVPSLNQATDAAEFFAAVRDDPLAAREKFGRKVGVSRTRYVVLRGRGKIIKVDDDEIAVALDPQNSEADIILQAGLVLGNTVRDATGLLEAGQFSRSQDFNDISSELNRIVETNVVSELKSKASVGRDIRFVGCTEIFDDAPAIRPLKVIPLDVDFN
jgi:predicted lipoprotein